jgi:hypothetical protein
MGERNDFMLGCCAHNLAPEHPGGACYEQPHRIAISALSPTTNL